MKTKTKPKTRPKMLFSRKEVEDVSREDLEDSYMSLYSAYITASGNRYRKSKNIAKDLLRKESLAEQKDALLKVIDYYNNFIDFRDLDYQAKRIVWYIISCLDIWNNDKLIPKVRKTSNLYAGVMDRFEVYGLLKKPDVDFIMEILTGERTIDRPWKEWEDKIVLPVNEELLRDEKSEMKYRAYQVGRPVSQVKEHFEDNSLRRGYK